MKPLSDPQPDSGTEDDVKFMENVIMQMVNYGVQTKKCIYEDASYLNVDFNNTYYKEDESKVKYVIVDNSEITTSGTGVIDTTKPVMDEKTGTTVEEQTILYNQTIDGKAYMKITYNETYYKVDDKDAFFTLNCLKNGLR